MARALGRRRVVAPDGVEWSVSRRWLTRRLAWPRRTNISSESLVNLGVPDVGDFGEGLLVFAVLLAVVLVVVPLLLFGIELITLGGLLAAGPSRSGCAAPPMAS